MKKAGGYFFCMVGARDFVLMVLDGFSKVIVDNGANWFSLFLKETRYSSFANFPSFNCCCGKTHFVEFIIFKMVGLNGYFLFLLDNLNPIRFWHQTLSSKATPIRRHQSNTSNILK